MIRKTIYQIGICASVLLIILVSGCLSEQKAALTTSTTLFQDNVDSTCNSDEPSCNILKKEVKVELYHFHGNRQCVSCKAVGSLAEKTVNTYYQKELKSGKIVFGHINYDDFANGALASKYEAKASSLWIGTYVDGEFHKEEKTRVWYKISDEEGYLQYLKGVLDKRLSGDLSE